MEQTGGLLIKACIALTNLQLPTALMVKKSGATKEDVTA